VIVFGSIVVLSIFLVVGWAVSTEMFQQRAWRHRAAAGDPDIIGALIEETLATWRRQRPPKGYPTHRWAALQGVELVAVSSNSATFSASVIPEYRTEGGQRLQVTSTSVEAAEIAAKLLDMTMYDIPNLRLDHSRVDIYAAFPGDGGQAVQRPVLTSTASRGVADEVFWESLTPDEILNRFETVGGTGRGGQAEPIELPPIEGSRPRPAIEAARAAGFEPGKDTSQ
jgi:hypothetical protein